MNLETDKESVILDQSGMPRGYNQGKDRSFVPTAVQLERAKALKRFILWVIYFPVGLVTTAVLALFIYLLFVAVRPPYPDSRLFLSGIADVILILALLPLTLIFGLLLLGMVGGLVYWRNSRNQGDSPSLQSKYGRLRLLLWKVDQKLSNIYRRADELLPRIAAPVIQFNAVIAHLNSWLGQFRRRSY